MTPPVDFTSAQLNDLIMNLLDVPAPMRQGPHHETTPNACETTLDIIRPGFTGALDNGRHRTKNLVITHPGSD